MQKNCGIPKTVGNSTSPARRDARATLVSFATPCRPSYLKSRGLLNTLYNLPRDTGTGQTENLVEPIEYGCSYIQCTWPYNSVRFLVESRTRLIDSHGSTQDYYTCASCKSEDTFASKDLFMKDNYDFLPIFGPAHGVIFRRRAWLNDNYKTVLPARKMWEGQKYDGIRPSASARILAGQRDIADATDRFLPIVAQTEMHDAGSGRRVIIEYPIKTMNINREQNLYQTDTGPVAFIDPCADFEKSADAIALAFVAFNTPDFADFVIEEPTPIEKDGKEICRIHHYSRILSLPAANRLFALR